MRQTICRFGQLTFLTSFIYLQAADSIASEWTTHNAMPTARSEIYCASVEHKIYVAGGLGFFRTVDACEVFNTRPSRWSSCPSLPYPLHHAAMAAHGNRVYANGGYVSLTFKPDPGSALWSLSTDGHAWQRVSSLPVPLGEHTMTAVGDELFLIGGRHHGEDSNQVWRYDIGTQQWSQQRPMPLARHSFAAVAVGTRIWVMGGRSAQGGSKLTDVTVYDTALDRWQAGPSLPVGRGGHSAVVLGQQIHVFGGEQFNPNRVLNRHDVLDIATGQWLQSTPSPTARHGSAAGKADAQAFVIGGGTRPGLKTVFSVSPKTEALAIPKTSD
ncbi:MAG: Kelch repeat-containing protein [Burkholderiaceae bacterium]